MPTELLLGYLKGCSDLAQQQFQIFFQCAPVIKGVKASNIITLPKEIWNELERDLHKALDGSGVSWLRLATRKAKAVIFLYRRDWLENILKQTKVQHFLKGYGYRLVKLDETLLKLQRRYQDYSEGKMGFPHEMGIFLHYPLADVKAFIENGGKNSLLNGYWKVYHNPQEARRVFHMYDRVKEKAAKEFMSEYAASRIAV